MTWETPPDGTERAERLKAWQATVADAIARTRRREGFDGTQRGWRTLGECLRPEKGAPKLIKRATRRRAKCPICWLPKSIGRPCVPCENRRRVALAGRLVG